MNDEVLEVLANWGEFVGGVAVVASLVYVGMQVRDSVKQSRLDSYAKTAELFANFTSSIYANPDTARVYRSGLQSFDTLDEEDKIRFHLMMSMYFGIVDTVMAYEKEGIYLFPESFRRHLDLVRGTYAMPGVRQWWDRMSRSMPSPQIAEYLERGCQ